MIEINGFTYFVPLITVCHEDGHSVAKGKGTIDFGDQFQIDQSRFNIIKKIHFGIKIQVKDEFIVAGELERRRAHSFGQIVSIVDDPGDGRLGRRRAGVGGRHGDGEGTVWHGGSKRGIGR